MRWSSPVPRDGAWRIVRRFAWWPTRVDSPEDTIVWLEDYWSEEEYRADVAHGYWLRRCARVVKQ